MRGAFAVGIRWFKFAGWLAHALHHLKLGSQPKSGRKTSSLFAGGMADLSQSEPVCRYINESGCCPVDTLGGARTPGIPL
jgi:hypothetical protein